MHPILSVRDLASRLGTNPEQLRDIAESAKTRYRVQRHDDPQKQKSRTLYVPDVTLKNLQRRIKTKILDTIDIREEAHGGVRGRSPKTNASCHLGQPCVVNIDIKKFFPHIRHRTVYRMFRHELEFGRDVARLLTRLVTIEGQVPQGAPTSTAIANLILTHPLDQQISRKAELANIRYTRFVDDVTLSGPNPRPLINTVGKCLSKRRLPLSMPKLKITSRANAQRVTGLIVNSGNGPSVPKKYRDGVRAAIFQLGNMTDEAAIQNAINSIRGRIAYVRQFNPGAARRLQRYLDLTLAASRKRRCG